MYSKTNKLVAILGGRPYQDNLTLRRFLIPPIREKLKNSNIDFIIATNNKTSAEQFKQINGLTIIETSNNLHNAFVNRQREVKTNLGAETRETINQCAIKNNYKYALHLDDNITSIFYRNGNKNTLVKKNKPFAFYKIIELLFYIIEHSNAGAIGMEMSAYPGTDTKVKVNAGFPYSFFVHRVDKNFKFENSTEDDILMSIYNGEQKKPSAVIRNGLYYGKTGKKTSKDGNRKIYQSMLKENKRGEYAEKMYPHIYTRKVSYMVKSSTIQKEPMLQHKHRLTKPKQWDKDLVINDTVIPYIEKTIQIISEKENTND